MWLPDDGPRAVEGRASISLRVSSLGIKRCFDDSGRMKQRNSVLGNKLPFTSKQISYVAFPRSAVTYM